MRRLALGLTIAAVFGLAGTAQAATFTVTSTSDTPTANPIGSCTTPCSLRDAVKDAQASADATDVVKVPPGTYDLPNDALTEITTDVTVEGTGLAGQAIISGADTTDNVTPAAGVFAVLGGKLTLRGLTISGNRVAGTAGTSGGAIAADFGEIVVERSILRGNRDEAAPPSNGVAAGAIGANGAVVTITDSAIEDNLWLGPSALNASGGVVVANAPGTGVTITRSSVSRNRADPPSGSSTLASGGVQLSDGTALTISDSTVSQNSVRTSASAFRAGGILTVNSPPFQPATPAITLTNVTLTDNAAGTGGSFAIGNAGFLGATEPRVIRNSIVAGGLPVNCGVIGGAITSSGGNLEDANTCNFTGPGDLFNTPPQLEALQRSGGAGLAQVPLPGSPALGLARPEFCSATDQRGLIRALVGGGACDSGAAETATVAVNTAAPSISGAAADGQTLTCSPGTWTQNPGFGFRWLSDGAVIAGATASTFTIGPAQLDTAVQCQVFAQNFAGVATATSAAVVPPKPPVVTPPTPPAPPVNTVRPRFSGTLRTGQRVACSSGTFAGATSLAVAWLRNGTPIAGATSLAYTLTFVDAGKALQCRVTATGPGGTVVAESTPAVPAKACIVPTLVAKTLAAAKKALTAANCAAGKTTTRKSTKKAGTVLSSSPAKGKNLAAGTKVALTLAKK
jgi:hypothetical protein